MCCKLQAPPSEIEIVELLAKIGQFEEISIGVDYKKWGRLIDDTQVLIAYYPLQVEFFLSPAVVTADDHLGKRNAAAAMFEMGARYADKIGGELKQVSINVPGCQEAGRQRLIASYPSLPLDFNAVCPGWRQVFTSEGLEP